MLQTYLPKLLQMLHIKERTIKIKWIKRSRYNIHFNILKSHSKLVGFTLEGT